MTKAELRIIYKKKRIEISEKEKSKLTDLILINFQKLDLPFISCVHTYMAIDEINEINTSAIIRYLNFLNPGLRVAVPKINNADNSIENFIYTNEMEMSLHKFGMKEPLSKEKIDTHEIDLILIPLLAFDKTGHRVGFGKGFYDRLLHQCRPDVIKTGLSFFEAEEKIIDVHTGDFPLDYCVTPQQVYAFK